MNKNDQKRKHLGRLGEELAGVFLKKQGYSIIEKNYWKPWGEIDLVTKKGNHWYFIEVKSVSCEKPETISCNNPKNYNPFEKIGYFKLKRLERTIFSYLNEKNVSSETNFNLHGVVVYVSTPLKTAKICVIENIL